MLLVLCLTLDVLLEFDFLSHLHQVSVGLGRFLTVFVALLLNYARVLNKLLNVPLVHNILDAHSLQVSFTCAELLLSILLLLILALLDDFVQASNLSLQL